MLKAKVVQVKNQQFILFPKEYKIKEKEFYISKYGECYYLVPVDKLNQNFDISPRRRGPKED